MDLTKNNPALAPLFTVSFPTDHFVLPNKKLPPPMRVEGAILYEALFGYQQDPEDFTFILKSTKGELQKFYGPSVGRDPNSDNLALKWGNSYTVLELDGANVKTPKQGNEGWVIEKLFGSFT